MTTLGNNIRVYINVGSSGTPTLSSWIVGEQTNSLNRTAEAIDTSDKSTQWEQFLSGKKGATAEVTVYADDTEGAIQLRALEALYESVGQVRVFVGEFANAMVGDLFTAIVTAISDTNDNGSVATRTISLTATGAVRHLPSLT